MNLNKKCFFFYRSWYISTKTQSKSLEIERLRREVQDLVDEAKALKDAAVLDNDKFNALEQFKNGIF